MEFFTSQVSGIVGLFLDNETLSHRIKNSEIIYMNVFFAEETLRGESIKIFYFYYI